MTKTNKDTASTTPSLRNKTPLIVIFAALIQIIITLGITGFAIFLFLFAAAWGGSVGFFIHLIIVILLAIALYIISIFIRTILTNNYAYIRVVFAIACFIDAILAALLINESLTLSRSWIMTVYLCTSLGIGSSLIALFSRPKKKIKSNKKLKKIAKTNAIKTILDNIPIFIIIAIHTLPIFLLISRNNIATHQSLLPTSILLSCISGVALTRIIGTKNHFYKKIISIFLCLEDIIIIAFSLNYSSISIYMAPLLAFSIFSAIYYSKDKK